MTTQPKYNRIEIVADLGFGNRVILFADFSAKGISMGIPHHVRILKGTPEEPQSEPIIDETQRTTTHADGVVKTHWPLPSGNNFKAPWEVTQPNLKSWTNATLQKEELDWSDEYQKFIKNYLIKPKRIEASPKTLQVLVNFTPRTSSSCATYSILRPSDLSVFMAKVDPQVQSWQVTGGCPYVVLTLSNVVGPKHVNIAEAGRIYI